MEQQKWFENSTMRNSKSIRFSNTTLTQVEQCKYSNFLSKLPQEMVLRVILTAWRQQFWDLSILRCTHQFSYQSNLPFKTNINVNDISGGLQLMVSCFHKAFKSSNRTLISHDISAQASRIAKIIEKNALA